MAGCRKCAYLAETRTQTVFGTGPAETRLMFIGEAPGADEDRQGKPFVGRAGQLLTDMITKGMGLTRDAGLHRQRAQMPAARKPHADPGRKSDNCIGYLEQQIAIIRPEFICLLGKVALARALEERLGDGPGPRQVVLLQGHPHDRHISPVLSASKARREARGVGRSSNAHERDGIEAAGTKTRGPTE